MKKLIVPLFGLALVLASCTKEKPENNRPQPVSSFTQTEQKTGTMMIAEAKKNLQDAKIQLKHENKYGCCL